MIDSTWVPYGVAMLLVLGACGSDDADDTQGDDGATTAATNADTGGAAASSAGDSSPPVDTGSGTDTDTGSEGDPSTTGTTGSETGVDASSSGASGAGFGEPCHASEDCASQICFLDQCSQTCESPADCPAPWTCDMGGALSICVMN